MPLIEKVIHTAIQRVIDNYPNPFIDLENYLSDHKWPLFYPKHVNV